MLCWHLNKLVLCAFVHIIILTDGDSQVSVVVRSGLWSESVNLEGWRFLDMFIIRHLAQLNCMSHANAHSVSCRGRLGVYDGTCLI